MDGVASSVTCRLHAPSSRLATQTPRQKTPSDLFWQPAWFSGEEGRGLGSVDLRIQRGASGDRARCVAGFGHEVRADWRLSTVLVGIHARIGFHE